MDIFNNMNRKKVNTEGKTMFCASMIRITSVKFDLEASY